MIRWFLSAAKDRADLAIIWFDVVIVYQNELSGSYLNWVSKELNIIY